VEAAFRVADGHQFTLGALVGVAAENQVDRLLGLVVEEGGEVFSVVACGLLPCIMGIPGSLLFVGGMQLLQGFGSQLEERWGCE
jgi:hypothetical protein